MPKGVAHGCDRGGLGYKLQACASGVLTPVPPLQKRGGQWAVVLCGRCRENFELGTSCKLAPAGEEEVQKKKFIKVMGGI